jgi:hypothetical protein
VPDILLYDNETYKTPIIIEVCHPNGLNNDMKKITHLIEENDYGVEEGLIYDYIQGIWYKYKKGVDQVFDNQSYSDVF